jgi:hypothetical protein
MSDSAPRREAQDQPADDPLWQRISVSPIGPTGTALTFAAKLARENGWTASHAARVIEEYRRFCYLGITAGHEVTPSDAVDQCWHLHLTYTRDYWDRFCPQVLGRPLHHGPTAGGAAELGRHFAQYAATLRSYEAAFGPPPRDIWPAAKETLLTAPRARRVNPADMIMIPRRALRLVGLVLLALGVLALVAENLR